MTKLDDGGSAFPRTGSFTSDGDKRFDSISLDGMSLRDWFAGQALPHLISGAIGMGPKQKCEQAYKYADAMLAARKKGTADE